MDMMNGMGGHMMNKKKASQASFSASMASEAMPMPRSGGGDVGGSDGGGRKMIESYSFDLVCALPLPRLASWLEGELKSLDGYLVSSSVSRQRADLRFRVPRAAALRLDAILRSRKDEISVRAQRYSGRDATVEFADAHARLDSLRRSVSRLLDLYSRAETVEEVLGVEAHLARQQAELEGAQARMAALEMQTETLEVHVMATKAVAADDDDDDEGGGLWAVLRGLEPLAQARRAAVDAARAAVRAVNAAARAAVFVVVFGAAPAGAALVALAVWRRGRHHCKS